MMIGIGILFLVVLWMAARRPSMIERQNKHHSQPWWGQR